LFQSHAIRSGGGEETINNAIRSEGNTPVEVGEEGGWGAGGAVELTWNSLPEYMPSMPLLLPSLTVECIRESPVQ